MSEWSADGVHPYWGETADSQKAPNFTKSPLDGICPPSEKRSESENSESENSEIDMTGIEEWREYFFATRTIKDNKETVVEAHTIRIDNPTKLTVRPSGSHIVEDSEGLCHYIPAGWSELCWKGKHDFNVDK